MTLAVDEEEKNRKKRNLIEFVEFPLGYSFVTIWLAPERCLVIN